MPNCQMERPETMTEKDETEVSTTRRMADAPYILVWRCSYMTSGSMGFGEVQSSMSITPFNSLASIEKEKRVLESTGYAKDVTIYTREEYLAMKKG